MRQLRPTRAKRRYEGQQGRVREDERQGRLPAAFYASSEDGMPSDDPESLMADNGGISRIERWRTDAKDA